MGRHAEQLSRGGKRYTVLHWHSRVGRAWVKRELRRARRRAERADVENVPPRLTKGWAD